jgi:hypothetical protein
MVDQKSDIASKQGSSGWHIALEKASGAKPYLGDTAVVDRLIREFIKGVLDRFDAVQEGKMLPAEASDMDKQSCERYGTIFVGGDGQYESIGAWNKDGLPCMVAAKFIQDIPAMADMNQSGVVIQFFAILTHLVYQAEKRYMKSSNDDAMKNDIATIVHSAVLALVGVESGFDKLYEVAE